MTFRSESDTARAGLPGHVDSELPRRCTNMGSGRSALRQSRLSTDIRSRWLVHGPKRAYRLAYFNINRMILMIYVLTFNLLLRLMAAARQAR